jgi:tRNA A-37 threonylcarbamoyl transferase component Bud32
MARVYRAVDMTLERDVAVKVMNPELRREPDFDARFQREARIASQLNSPHIVVVHDFGIDAGLGPYLVMEYLVGQSLRQMLQTSGPLPVRAGLEVSAQLFLALIHAHEKGIIHRDLKPDNVFILDQSGIGTRLRVLDFGIARMVHRAYSDHAETLTQPGAVLGTPRYMSPEQLAGQPLDARSDLYSAALVIHESLTGVLPFASQKTLTESCPEVPPAVQDLLQACLQPHPADRPASALHAYRRLQEGCTTSGILAPGSSGLATGEADAEAPTVVYTNRRRKLRRYVVLAAAGAALLGLSVWAVFSFFPVYTSGTDAKESIVGIAIGDSRDELVAKFGKPERQWKGDPWQDNESLGLVLRPDNLSVAGAWEGYESLAWFKGQICAVLRDNVVQALVIRQPFRARNGRGLSMGDNEARLENLYPEKPDIDTVDAPPASGKSNRKTARWVKVYRYSALGIGFEVRDEKLRSMVIFPPQSD